MDISKFISFYKIFRSIENMKQSLIREKLRGISQKLKEPFKEIGVTISVNEKRTYIIVSFDYCYESLSPQQVKENMEIKRKLIYTLMYSNNLKLFSELKEDRIYVGRYMLNKDSYMHDSNLEQEVFALSYPEIRLPRQIR